MKRLLAATAALALLAGCDQSAQEIGAKVDALGNQAEAIGEQVEDRTSGVVDALNSAASDVAGAVDDAIDGANRPTDKWLGKWIGVEGLVLDIKRAPTAADGDYALSVTLLDGTSEYLGTADGQVIRFERDGKPATIRAATGDQTGLKYLAGKKDCLMIAEGEGFCRD